MSDEELIMRTVCSAYPTVAAEIAALRSRCEAAEAEVVTALSEQSKHFHAVLSAVTRRAEAAEAEVERLTREREDYREKRANEVDVMREARDLFRDERDRALVALHAALADEGGGK